MPDETRTLPDLSNFGALAAEDCSNCRFYFTHEGLSSGACRARAPLPVLIGMQPPQLAGRPPVPIVDGFFPPTKPGIWCGDYKPRAEAVSGRA